jgi:hypothetical protein
MTMTLGAYPWLTAAGLVRYHPIRTDRLVGR